MVKWGVVYSLDGDITTVHVVPVDDEGFVIEHRCAPEPYATVCFCKPVRNAEGFWIHNDPQRGGYDS